MKTERISEIRRWANDGQVWPYDTRDLLDALEDAEKRVKQAQREGERKGIERAAKVCDGLGIKAVVAAKHIRNLEVGEE